MSQLFQSTFHTLTMDEAKIEIEDNPNIIIVDVRTPEEYQKDIFPGNQCPCGNTTVDYRKNSG